MRSDEIRKWIANGENAYLEFKEETIKARDLAEEIVAFANSEGGTILLGVDDGGNIIGVSDQAWEEKIMNICRNNCIPHIIPSFEAFTMDGKTVAAVKIGKGRDKPYYTIDQKYYIRVGTTKRIASREELLRLFEANGSLHFDISPVEGRTIRDLNLDVIRDYFLKYNMFDLNEESREATERILLNADILRETNDEPVCTVGGMLIFGKNPKRSLPQHGVSFAHFQGSEITDELIDKKVVEGRLPDIAEQVMVVLKNNMKTPSVIRGLVREEQAEYPSLVLREALINALVHRNYSIVGSKIRIFMFDDRIEFHSPGRLPNTVTVEKMKIGISYARNPFLVKYMENLRYIDQLGRGIPMIFKTMEEMGACEPLLREDGEEFVLIVYKA